MSTIFSTILVLAVIINVSVGQPETCNYVILEAEGRAYAVDVCRTAVDGSGGTTYKKYICDTGAIKEETHSSVDCTDASPTVDDTITPAGFECNAVIGQCPFVWIRDGSCTANPHTIDAILPDVCIASSPVIPWGASSFKYDCSSGAALRYYTSGGTTCTEPSASTDVVGVCVEMDQYTWSLQDAACDSILSGPTQEPTVEPTWQPTVQPTDMPSAPTMEPTLEPSIPTSQPTEMPSYDTDPPTEQPTYGPTDEPTEEPTYGPTEEPTTAEPTSQPVIVATEDPYPDTTEADAVHRIAIIANMGIIMLITAAIF